MEHSIIISEEGPLPQYRSCDVFTANVESDSHRSSLVACHRITEKCWRYFERLAWEQCLDNITFSVNGVEINRVCEFKYLDRILEESANDTVAAEWQLA